MRHVIRLTGLKVWGYHGVLESERAYGQDFFIDATLWLELPSNLNDEIAKTVNYAKLSDALKADAQANPVNLIETLAQRLASVALKTSGNLARKVEITVHKPNAPIDGQFTDVSVTVKVKQSPRNGTTGIHV
ncbi:MAG: dihydroneopterin aldolase [Micrococcales bacterium]